MALLILGLGLVLVIEGLAFALAPSRLEDVVRAIADMPIGTRRAIGLGAMALGLGLLIAARSMGAF
ncbi:DUF2065 family protein [Aliiroseovarius sp. PTFE2010]|uniref:DUF2065 family protein n=1 Tax=Aliiroseovarius sp. PTFE2010 TaxID=3417190 RepID=UPI003CF6D610